MNPVLNDSATRNILRANFITDLAIVVGDADVLAPKGFEKLALDLNYGTPGPFIFLCIQRGMCVLAFVDIATGKRLEWTLAISYTDS